MNSIRDICRQMRSLLNLLQIQGVRRGYLSQGHVAKVASEARSDLMLALTVACPVSERPAEGEAERLEEHLREVLMLGNGVSSDLLDDAAWDSVYWVPAWANPRRTSTVMNRILKKIGEDSFEVRVPAFGSSLRSRRSSTSGGPAPGDTLRFLLMAIGYLPNPHPELRGGGNGQNGLVVVGKAEITRFLAENHNRVHWDGEEFAVRPFMLYKVDEDHLSSNMSLGTFNLKVERYVFQTLSFIQKGVNNVFFPIGMQEVSCLMCC